MPTQSQIFKFPTKGVNRLGLRSAQPPDTAFDMLNVMPFDRENLRLRGGKRSGDVKLWAGTVGDTADAVLWLDQVTLLGHPDTADTVFSDTFTYSNGAIDSVTGGVWSQEINEGFDGGSVQIISNQMGMNGRANKQDAASSFKTVQPVYTVADGYTLECDVTIKDGNTNLVGNVQIGFVLETAQSYSSFGPDAIGAVEVYFLGNGSGAITLNTTTDTDGEADIATPIVSNTPFHLKLVVSSSHVLTVFINGVNFPLSSTTLHAVNQTKRQIAFYHQTGSDSHQIRIDNLVFTGSNPDTSTFTRQTKIIGVANRDVFMGDINTQGTTVGSGSNVIAKSVIPGGAYSSGKYYFVDGTSTIKQLDVTSATMESYVASSGTAPANVTLACIWRDRLVVAGPDQNFFMSRVGDQHDWLYDTDPADDPARAFEGNASTAGHIGEPIVALMPLSDDLLGIGGDHNLWVIRGDPADNGSIDEVSNQIGILGPQAWCQDPNGNIYFLGTYGLFRWNGVEKPVSLSDEAWTSFFSGLDRDKLIIILRWHRDHRGLYIFIYKKGLTPGSPVTQLFWSVQTGGFFPLQFPVAHGPTAALVYDGDSPSDRALILGGRDGYVRKLSDTAKSDDGTAINGYVDFGPFPIGDQSNDGIISQVNVTLGEPPPSLALSDFGVNVEITAALTAYDLTDGSATAKIHKFGRRYDGTKGRLQSIRQKMRGVFGMLRLFDNSSTKTFSFEDASVDIEPAGKTRR